MTTQKNHRHTNPEKSAEQSDKRDGSKGSILVLFALVLTALMATAGLVVDIGLVYVTRANLTKAVDAGALAGARHSSRPDSEMRSIIMDIADANFPIRNDDTTYSVSITTPGIDTKRILVTGNTVVPALFAQIVGKKEFPLQTIAEAMRYPLDMSLVLDVSLSLEEANAFDDVQDASIRFLEFFDEDVDQFGLVTYSTAAQEQMPLAKRYESEMKKKIKALEPIVFTNMEEGLRLAKDQIEAAPQRDNAVRVVVIFTDGRPTAFADDFRMEACCKNPKTYDGIVATGSSGSWYGGLYENLTGYGWKIDYFKSDGTAKLVKPDSFRVNSPKPQYLPGGASVNGNNIRALAISQAEDRADAIRDAGYLIFAIGLGNPNSSNASEQPDLPFLRRLANENGVTNKNQPRGQMFFAPTPEDLDKVFARVADRILTRMTR